jgi:hypothetical protein
MENGKWKMEERPYSLVFSICHLPSSIQAGIFQRPANGLRYAGGRLYGGPIQPATRPPNPDQQPAQPCGVSAKRLV